MSTLLPRNTISYKIVTISMTKGRATKSEADSTFVGSVQPTTGKDLESLPTNRGDIGTVKVYSDTQLNVSIAGTNKPGDVIIWDGQRWEAISEGRYLNSLIEHYKYICEFRGNV